MQQKIDYLARFHIRAGDSSVTHCCTGGLHVHDAERASKSIRHTDHEHLQAAAYQYRTSMSAFDGKGGTNAGKDVCSAKGSQIHDGRGVVMSDPFMNC